MNPPAWYRELIAEHGGKVMSGAETQEQASAAIAVALAARPEFLAALAARDVSRWTDRHEQPDLIQAVLFEHIPAMLPVAVGRKARVRDMTKPDLDNARRMIVTRTTNAARSASRQRKEFLAFYNAVIPHLRDGRTVGDVLVAISAAVKAA